MNLERVRGSTIVALLALVAVLSTPTFVGAQSGGLKAKIPFEFYIGSQKFPAGDYTLLRRHTDRSVVQVLGDNKHNIAIVTRPISTPIKDKPELVFNRYGGYHFLSEVHWDGSSSGGQMPPSSFERELAKGITAEKVVSTNLR